MKQEEKTDKKEDITLYCRAPRAECRRNNKLNKKKNSKEHSIIITLNDVSIFFTFPFVWLFVRYIIVFSFVTELFLIIFVCTFTVMLFFRERISSFSFDKEEENRIDGMNVLVRCVAGWSHLLCWPPGIVTGYSAPNSNGGKSGKDTVSLRWAVMQSSSSRGGGPFFKNSVMELVMPVAIQRHGSSPKRI